MPGRSPRATGLPARVRAAVAYADLHADEVAAHMSISVTTLNRWMTGPKAGKAGETYNPPDADQRAALAALCHVPASFLHHGWHEPSNGNGDIEERLNRLEDVISAMIAVAAEREGALRQPPQDDEGRTDEG